MNTLGSRLRLHLFGESHGPAIGGVLDGVPAGMPVDLEEVKRRMDQRRPGSGPLVSQRNEPDEVEVLSGVFDGKATGAPLAFIIRNQDTRPKDYDALRTVARPGHADLTEHIASKGHRDHRGGGHSSGRLTAVIVAAGALLQPLLSHAGIHVGAHVARIHDRAGPSDSLDAHTMDEAMGKSPVHTAHADMEEAFIAAVAAARKAKDSVGGVVEWKADGVPAGLGGPIARGVESALSSILFSIPAVKGVQFGAGFEAVGMHGSEHNDPLRIKGGKVEQASNHAGGILGGRTTGAPLWGHVAIKPTSSIAQIQDTVDLQEMQDTTVEVKGRHDPCIAIRGAPVVRGAIAFALADLLLAGIQDGHVEAPSW